MDTLAKQIDRLICRIMDYQDTCDSQGVPAWKDGRVNFVLRCCVGTRIEASQAGGTAFNLFHDFGLTRCNGMQDDNDPVTFPSVPHAPFRVVVRAVNMPEVYSAEGIYRLFLCGERRDNDLSSLYSGMRDKGMGNSLRLYGERLSAIVARLADNAQASADFLRFHNEIKRLSARSLREQLTTIYG